MLVEVFSDVVCPWCFVGKRRLARAIESVDFDVEVVWRSYELDPRAPAEPQDIRDLLARKYGNRRAFESMTARLTPLGAAEGIDFRWDRVQRVNTFDAHRLLEWAGDADGWQAQGRLKEALMTAYFTDGENVADHATLARLAGECDLDTAVAVRVLADDDYADAVRADEARARELEISGVPAFLIEGRFLIPGAQEPETMRLALTRAKDRLSSSA